jgi:hypothetical protein
MPTIQVGYPEASWVLPRGFFAPKSKTVPKAFSKYFSGRFQTTGTTDI